MSATTNPTPTPQHVEVVGEPSSRVGKRARDAEERMPPRFKRARYSIPEDKKRELLAKLKPLEKRFERIPVLGTPEPMIVTGELDELCDLARLTEVLLPEVEAMYAVEE
ncbi:hypothetical protein BGX34_002990, partial [Mortierella sp. NVP85]